MRQILLAVVLISIFATPSFAADVRNTTHSLSWTDMRNFLLRGTPLAHEEAAQTLRTQTLSSQSPNYSGNQPQGGTVSSDFSQWTINGNALTTTAHEVVPPAAGPPQQALFTIEGNGQPAHYGPPSGTPFYTQPQSVQPGVSNPALLYNYGPLLNAPYGDTQAAAYNAIGAFSTASHLMAPSFTTAQSQWQAQTQNAGQASGGEAASTFGANINLLETHLINVGNDGAGVPTQSNASHKTIAQSVWMVQQMLKQVYLPIAILLLLPGALMTQSKGQISFGFLHANNEDTISPFVGILRALVAVFLLGATQLIVSYAIDIGNTLTDEVAKHISTDTLVEWGRAQTQQHQAANPAAQQAANGEQTTAEAFREEKYNGLNMLLNNALLVLVAYQTVMVCYLAMMGPLTAAFYAWPQGVGKLFRPMFAGWIDALVNLVLWRFWWCLILLCMSTRLEWLKEIGQYNPTSPWEGIVYTAFLVMLTYVPFMPFDFRPGEMVDQMISKAQGSAGAGGAGGGAGSNGNAGNPSATAGGSDPLLAA